MCSGDQTTLEVSGADNYQWSTGFTGNKLVVKPYNSSWYSLTATSMNGCSHFDSILVTVHQTPTSSVQYSSTFDSVVCPGTQLFLYANAGPFTPMSTLHEAWSTGDTSYSIHPTILSDTIFSVTLSDRITGCSSKASVAFKAHLNRPDFQFGTYSYYIPPFTTCKGKAYTLQVTDFTGGSAGYRYLWSTGDTLNKITIGSATSNTNYWCQVTSPLGCTSTGTVSVTVDSISPYSISGNHKVCAGSPTTLYLSGPDTYNFNWNPSNDTLQFTPYSTSTIGYTITSPHKGCIQSYYDTIQVMSSTLHYSSDTILCQGATTTLSAFNGSNYQWNTGDTTSTITVAPTNSSVYSLHVNFGTTCSAVHNFLIGVLPQLPVSVTGDFNACKGEVTGISAPAGLSYSWSTGDTTQSITLPANTPTQAIWMQMNLMNGCKGLDTIIHTLSENPLLTFFGKTTVCTGDSTYIVAAGTNIATKWYDNTTSPGKWFVVQNDTTYPIHIVNNYGCSIDTTLLLEAYAHPLPALLAPGGYAFCTGDSTLLICDLSPGQYFWNTSATTQSITVHTSGTYSVQFTDSNGCRGLAAATTTMNRLPVVQAGSDTLVLPGATVNLGGLVPATGIAPFNFQWIPGINLSDSTAMHPNAFIQQEISYVLVVTDSNGCINSDTIHISVQLNQALQDHEHSAVIYLYPNPTSGLLQLRAQQLPEGMYQINIYQLSGALVMKKSFLFTGSTFEDQIDISTLNSGSYQLQLVAPDGHTENVRVLKID